MNKKEKISIKRTSPLQSLAMDGIFTAILIILGMIKIPSFLPGAEFQLSAPYAICLASFVGFQRYLCIGVCSSLIQLMLGTHTVWNVMIAMVFRVAAGLILTVLPHKKIVLAAAGPIGTIAARIVLAMVMQVPVMPLLLAAAPGMVFTGIAVFVMMPMFQLVHRVFPASGKVPAL